MKNIMWLILILTGITALFIAPYILKLSHTYENATPEDFANFGSYVSGVLTPIYTLVSVIFIGYQIIETGNKSKLERIVAENKAHLKTLVIQTQGINDLQEVEKQAYSSFLRGENVLLSILCFYKKNSKTIETFSIVSDTLSQVKLLDKQQYEILRSSMFSLIYREDIARLERLKFYLDAYRDDTCPSTFKWICKESIIMVEE